MTELKEILRYGGVTRAPVRTFWNKDCGLCTVIAANEQGRTLLAVPGYDCFVVADGLKQDGSFEHGDAYKRVEDALGAMR